LTNIYLLKQEVVLNTIGKGRLTNKLFIEKSNLIHLNKYDYSITEYIKSNEKVKISCKKHGPFEINVNSHLNGRGCSKCSVIINTKLANY
jgi:hypothetical protein